MSTTPPRRADRLVRPSWLNLPLVLGVLLLLGSVVAGARLFASADDTTPVYVAAHALVPGERLTATDLTVGRAQLDGEATNYVSASRPPPAGYVVQRFIGSGELLPLHAIAAVSGASSGRLVTLPVQPGHLPPDVGPGALVDVYVSARTASGAAPGRPRLVASSLAVDSRQGGQSVLSGSTVLSLVVSVPSTEVEDVVHAVEGGVIDIVEVPPATTGTTP
jgi:hypothetical protein